MTDVLPIDSPAVLGRAVRTMRKQLGLTQPELAMTAGTSVRFVVELERGKPTCRLSKVMDVLATLGARFDVVAPAGIGLGSAEDTDDGTTDGSQA